MGLGIVERTWDQRYVAGSWIFSRTRYSAGRRAYLFVPEWSNKVHQGRPANLLKNQ
jgi:hypothetical protein